MTVETLPWSVQGQSHPATVARNAQAGLLGAPVAAVSPAVQILTAGGGHGVTGSGDLAVTQNGTPNMSVNVAAGRAFIRGTETASLNQGVYSFFNDATVNLTIGAADPTNPRRDLIVAQVRDLNYSGAVSDARLAVIAGTAAASPSDPTPPANALVLARVTVAAGVTSVTTAAITDLRTRASSLGATQVCLSTTRPAGAALYNGLEIWETDTQRSLRYDGTGWIVMSEPAQTFTVTGAGWTLGNGTFTGVSHRSDGFIDVNYRFLLGTTSAITGRFSVALPVAASGLTFLLSGNMYGGGNEYPAMIGTDGSNLYIDAIGAAGAYALWAPLSATIPFTWASGNEVRAATRYRMATRYS